MAKKTFSNEMVINEIRNASALVSRYALSGLAGSTFGGDRDLFTLLGYKQDPTIADYRGQYDRVDIAGRIIDAYPAATWSDPPDVYDSEDEGTETAFERAWDSLAQKHKIIQVLRRADTLAGLGQYAIILIGFAGADALDKPLAGSGKKLIYLAPYGQDVASIQKYEEDPTNPRFGLPAEYQISATVGLKSISMRVHHSRVIHIAEGALDNLVFGQPRLGRVFNRINDTIKVIGGSAEMFWRAAFKGLHADIDKEFTPSADSLEAFKDSMDEYFHNLRRVIRTQGVTISPLSGETSDPTGIFQAIMQLISGSTGIPMRILLGSERGELASSQDERNWNKRVQERQATHAEPNILRPLVDRLIEAGALPRPLNGEYEIEWPDLLALGKTEKADIGLKHAQAASTLISSGAEQIITREELRVTLGYEAMPEQGFEESEEDLPEDDREDERAATGEAE